MKEISCKERLQKVLERIEQAAERSGRRAGDITLMAVTKTHPVSIIDEAYQAGLRLFGENRIREAEEKFLDYHPEEIELHMIGHLQRNKAKNAVGLCRCVQSVDKYSTASALEKECLKKEETIDILLEVNTSGEESKYGCPDFDTARTLLEKVLSLRNVRVKGLMTMAPFTDNEPAIRNSFRMLSDFHRKLTEAYPDLDLPVLSMGMTNDFEIAIEEGSTMVRIGSALFGPRK